MENGKISPTDKSNVLNILHVLGSPTNDWSFNLNVIYGSAFDNDLGGGKYVFTYAIVRPNGIWSFAENLSKTVVTNSNLEGKESGVKKMDISSALSHIKSVLKPDAALVHFVCEKGMTIYRSLFEALEIPLIGGGAKTRYISMDKLLTKSILTSHVSCPEGIIFRKGDHLDEDKISYPCVVKASKGEDSLAVRLAKDTASFKKAIENALHYSNIIIIERFIKGREIRCAVVKSRETGVIRALSCIEYLVNQDGIRTTEDKYRVNEDGLPIGKPTGAKTRFLDPSIEGELINRVQHESIRAFRALGIEDFALFDFRVDEDEKPWILECNLFCSFSPQSVVNIIAKNSGITDEELFDIMVQNALLTKTLIQ